MHMKSNHQHLIFYHNFIQCHVKYNSKRYVYNKEILQHGIQNDKLKQGHAAGKNINIKIPATVMLPHSYHCKLDGVPH